MRRKWALPLLSISVIIVCCAILAVMWILPYLTSVDPAEQQAALFALDHTPMEHILQVQIYTGGPTDLTVTGTNAFGRKLYAFVRNNSATIVYQSQTVSKQKAEAAIYGLHARIASIVSAVPGLVDRHSIAPVAQHASGNAVWEITARLRDGGFLFAYVDMYSGKLLTSFQTDNAPTL
ncbi:MAG: hypothetical protein ACYCVB_10485 [Bacilli bacterium]